MEKIKLGEIFEYLPKSKFKAGDGKKSGKYKFFTSSNIQNKFIDEFIYDGEYLIFGTGGKASINYCNDKFSTSTDNFVVKVNKEVNTKLVFLYFQYNMEKLEKGFKGASIKHISKQYINQLMIPKYDYQQQLKIVRELNKVQEIINIRKKQIEQLDELIKSQFIEMFGNPFETNNWQQKKLHEISESISDGSNVDKIYYQESGDVLFLRIQNVWSNEFRLEDSVYISEEVNKKYFDTSLHKGDLLITKIGRYYTKDSSLGRVSIYLGQDDKANYSNNIMRIRLKEEVYSEFVNILLNLEDYQKYIKRVSVGGTDKRALSKTIIGEFPIIVPPIELQNAYIKFAKPIEKQKLETQKSLEEMQKLQESLMSKYFRNI